MGAVALVDHRDGVVGVVVLQLDLLLGLRLLLFGGLGLEELGVEVVLLGQGDVGSKSSSSSG